MDSIKSAQEFKSRKEWEDYVWSKIIKGLAGANSERKVAELLGMLLTAHERQQLIKRASAISLLKQGKSYSKIGEILWLSPQTISAIKKSMGSQSGYTSRYSRSKKPKKEWKLLADKEWRQIKFSMWLEGIFTLPYPPLPHPRLMRLLGHSSKKRY